jgi:tRNA pseudouridine55 synthase
MDVSLDGVLVVDKPAGPTSHDIVDRARKALGLRRVGHTGTLDPFATGVLPLCLGKATRLARFLAEGEKAYRATIRLGFATSTDDATGAPLRQPRPVTLDRAAIEGALARLVGRLDQVPPAYSAKHEGGRRLYELARRGDRAPRAPVAVTIHEITLRDAAEDRLEIDVRCSPGTYVRALARDLGESLGVGGHLTALRRTRSGAFGLDQAVTALDLGPSARERVIPLEGLLIDLPAACVSAAGRDAVRHGRDLGRAAVLSGFPERPVARLRIVDEQGRLLALAVPRDLAPERQELPVEPVLHPDIVLCA